MNKKRKLTLGTGLCHTNAYSDVLAGVEGVEPANAGIKIRCLNQLGDTPTRDYYNGTGEVSPISCRKPITLLRQHNFLILLADPTRRF